MTDPDDARAPVRANNRSPVTMVDMARTLSDEIQQDSIRAIHRSIARLWIACGVALVALAILAVLR